MWPHSSRAGSGKEVPVYNHVPSYSPPTLPLSIPSGLYLFLFFAALCVSSLSSVVPSPNLAVEPAVSSLSSFWQSAAHERFLVRSELKFMLSVIVLLHKFPNNQIMKFHKTRDAVLGTAHHLDYLPCYCIYVHCDPRWPCNNAMVFLRKEVAVYGLQPAKQVPERHAVPLPALFVTLHSM